MAHLHSVADNDLYFLIDPDTRSITYDGENSPVIAQTDHNSEYFTFEIPRFVEGHDMLLCDLVEVHYINISSESSLSRVTGVYKVTDLKLDPEDEEENTLLCSWLITQNATSMVGSLSFALRFACTSGSKVDYNWSTGVFSGVTIIQTIDNAGVIVEQYTDILQAWYEELVMAGVMGVNIVTDAANKALEAIATAEQEAIDHLQSVEIIHEVEEETLDNIRNVGQQNADMVSENGTSAYNAIKSAETSAKTNISSVEAAAIERIRATESEIIEEEREELISELLDRVILSGNNYYLKAEGVSV